MTKHCLTEPPYSEENPLIFRFPTWGDYLHHVETAPTCAGSTECSSKRADTYTIEFTGTKNWEEAMRLAHNGWREGAERAAAVARRLEARIIHRIVRDDYTFDVEGLAFHLDRYLAGEPEHFIRIEESTVQGADRHVRIAVSNAISYVVKPDAVITRGAILTALVELLEYAGMGVELWLVDASSRSASEARPLFISLVKLKAYDQPLDPPRIAFALAHPSSLRRLGFRMLETSHESMEILVHRSYGYPVDYVPDGTSVYVEKCRSDGPIPWWHDSARAEAWILARLAKQGVTLTD
jgi:hypothetical protein